MNYHDTRDEYDAIARYLEENDTEVDWKAVMESDWWVGPADWVPPPKWSLPKPFPSPISPQTVTNLLFAQVTDGLRIPCWPGESAVSPVQTLSDLPRVETADSQPNAPGGAGVEPAAAAGAGTGPTSWKKFLATVAELQLQQVTISLVTPEERKALVRMAWIEEELRKRDVEWNRERVQRQNRGRARARLRRREAKRLRTAAGRGNREAIEELERRGEASEEEIGKWKEGLAERVARCKAMRKARKVKSLFWPGDDEMKKTKAKEVEEEVDDRKRELMVTRVGPNPRILTCSYESGGEEFTCLVRVKDVKKFKRGMKFEMEEPGGNNGEAWEYSGKLPRMVGRW
jgi:hypothetical protein